VLRIRTAVDETIDRATYSRTIEQPLLNAIAKGNLEDRVLYLVLTKGVPLRVAGTFGQTGTVASVDSELTLLYRAMTGQTVRVEGPVANPYFLGDRETTEAKPFTHREHDIFLVSRLDGYSFDDVKGLIDHGVAPRAEGQIVLDQRDALVNRVGENWLADAAKRLSADPHGTQVMLEATAKPARDVTQVLGYFSWARSIRRIVSDPRACRSCQAPSPEASPERARGRSARRRRPGCRQGTLTAQPGTQARRSR
jgi:uncharacterized protein (TIGR03790 family)